MLNVSQKEKKCVRYLANEMSIAEQSVFEIELSLDDDLLAIFENFKTIWISYPERDLINTTISFEDILHKNNRLETVHEIKKSYKKIYFSMASILVFCLSFYFLGTTKSDYTNHRIANKGQRLSLILPDKSTVILNSGSEVKYSSDFNKQRNIWLKGEAFFKVTKDINLPFVVHTNDFDIKVLGTEFNVNSNTINQTVSLAKGKVNVFLKESNDEINLIPNEELVWNSKTKAVIKRNFDLSKVLAWKDNVLLLDNEKFQDALPKINQFYGVNFVIKDYSIANQHINGSFDNQTLDEFITSLEFISDVRITKTGQNKIEISKYHE